MFFPPDLKDILIAVIDVEATANFVGYIVCDTPVFFEDETYSVENKSGIPVFKAGEVPVREGFVVDISAVGGTNIAK